jgi:hypothetical protein
VGPGRPARRRLAGTSRQPACSVHTDVAARTDTGRTPGAHRFVVARRSALSRGSRSRARRRRSGHFAAALRRRWNPRAGAHSGDAHRIRTARRGSTSTPRTYRVRLRAIRSRKRTIDPSRHGAELATDVEKAQRLLAKGKPVAGDRPMLPSSMETLQPPTSRGRSAPNSRDADGCG